MSPEFETLDFLSDSTIVDDPYPYYEFLRECPIRTVPPHDLIAVTGYDEAAAIWKDEENFSSCNSFGGPFHDLPIPPGADDISDLIAHFRESFPISEHLVTFDPPMHNKHRALMMRLMTPRRLQENEGFMARLADQLIDEFAEDGRADFIRAYASPFALLTIADLLGVPEEDHKRFWANYSHVAGALGQQAQGNPFAFIDDVFSEYVVDRRENPTGDVLTKLAQARFPDGSEPEVLDVVRIAVFLFAAGQGTTSHLLGSVMQRLADRPDLQQALRADPARIPVFIEEILRLESPVKANFRMVRRSVEIGDTPLRAGSTIMIMPGAANRDPRRFDDPVALRMDRANGREHIAFGRGNHACPGGPLARAEVRISLERLLDRLDDIRLNEASHGAPGDRRFTYDPSFMLRGLKTLHIEYKLKY
jgi:cytochrome P450